VLRASSPDGKVHALTAEDLAAQYETVQQPDRVRLTGGVAALEVVAWLTWLANACTGSVAEVPA
jgi:hypothetical protein